MAMAVMIASTYVAPLAAQAPQNRAYDPSDRLREVLPPEVADHVLATIAASRSRGLPTQALERIALKGAARQVPPTEIQSAVDAQAARLSESRRMLTSATDRQMEDDEIEAGAEALRKGVDGSSVSGLAKTAPSGRSLAVPLYVLGSLVERGLPSDDALAAVVERLSAKATDAQIAELPEQAATMGRKPAETGRDLAATRRSPAAGGPPASVPANAGAGAKPNVPTPARPDTPRRP